jgi:hypothetical protein
MSTGLTVWFVSGVAVLGAEPSKEAGQPAPLSWHADYARATDAARQEGRLLLVCFYRPGESQVCKQFESEALSSPKVLERLKGMVRVKVPVDATIRKDGEELVLLKHSSFAEMLGRPGVAIIDFAHKDAEHYGQVVSTFPFINDRPYTASQMAVILDLPPGTLTQRTLIYAVRTHPERPASTEGQFDQYLAKEATQHASYQARIRLQGHHNWNRRFHRINAKLPQGLLACEVCAESWPGEGLLEAAIDCVHSWHYSSGHWRAVRARHRVYGYDMKRGSNGIWYATGIFGRG